MSVPAAALWRALAPWLRALGLGAALGLCIAGGQRAGIWSAGAALGAELGARASPLWPLMLACALRAGWLCARALRTRLESRVSGPPVRPELATLARIFPVLGVLGTLWQVDGALAALGGSVSLARLPELSSALVPALLGVALQVATLRLAAHAPVWSLVRVTRSGERELYRLDHRLLGEGEPGLRALLDALDARRPEALHLDLDALLSEERCAALHARIASRIDGPVALAAPLPGMLDPLFPPRSEAT